MQRSLPLAVLAVGILGGASLPVSAQQAQVEVQVVRENQNAQPARAAIRVVPAVPAQRGADADQRLKRQLEVQAKQEKARMDRLIAVRLDELNHVCELSESQHRKLGLAAKGAVSRTMDKWTQQMGKMMGGRLRGLNFRGVVQGNAAQAIQIQINGVNIGNAPKDQKPKDDEDQVPEEKPAEDAAPNDPFAAKADAAIMMAAPGFSFSSAGADPTQESIWMNTVRKVLTEEQWSRYQNHLAARQAFRRQAGVHSYVSRLDQRLFLSRDQREKLIALVDQRLGSRLANVTFDANPMGWMMMDQMANQGGQLPKSEMKKLLTDAQFQTWQQTSRGGFNRGIIFNRIQAPLPSPAPEPPANDN